MVNKYLRVLLLVLMVAATVLFPLVSEANPTVYGGALTYHLDREKDYNETNFALFLEYEEYVVGGFNNSYYNDTYLVGKYYNIERDGVEIGVILGGMKGYKDEDIFLPCVSDDVCMAVAPVLTWTESEWQPTIMFGGTFVSLLIGYEF